MTMFQGPPEEEVASAYKKKKNNNTPTGKFAGRGVLCEALSKPLFGDRGYLYIKSSTVLRPYQQETTLPLLKGVEEE